MTDSVRDGDAIARERVASLDRFVLSEIKRLDEVFGRFEESVANRFVAGNEFRASLSDVQSQMATRRELEAFQTEYRTQHTALLQSVAELRTSVAVGPKEVSELVRQASRDTGRREGFGVSANVLFSVTSIFVALIAAAAAVVIATH